MLSMLFSLPKLMILFDEEKNNPNALTESIAVKKKSGFGRDFLRTASGCRKLMKK